MRKPFDGDFRITQYFGVNKEDYTQFGLQGHNGIDYATPTGTPLLAPHSGKVIEATLDPAGYGLYIKIENDKEGSVLAHQKEFRVGVGDNVTEGQLIGYSDNSGNSTGPHLHWGYYLFPRNRQNGFAGFIDQINLISQPSGTFVDEATFVNLVRKSTNWDNTIKELNTQDSWDIVKPQLIAFLTYEDKIREKETQISEAQAKIAELQATVEKDATALKTLQETTTVMQNEVSLAKDKNSFLQTQIDELQKTCQQPVIFTGWKNWIFQLLKAL